MFNFKFNQEWRSRLISNGTVLFFALIGFVQFEFKPNEPTIFENLTVQLLAPLQKSVTKFKSSVAGFFDHYINIVNTSKDNEFLKRRLAEVSQEAFELSSLAKENIRLKALLAFGEKVPHKKVLGQVIGWDASTEYKILRIDKGREDGIETKSAVITSAGLVGHTYRVYDHYSDILTILDANNRVDVVVDRTRTHGILEGISLMNCRMKYVPRTEELVRGDLLVTAGLSMIYPKGIQVGKIIDIKSSPEDLTQEITVEPAVDFTKLEEVVVLITPSEEKNLLTTPIGEQSKVAPIKK